MRARVSARTIATGSPVGNEPMSGTWATTPRSLSDAAQQQPAAARLTGGVDGAPQLLGGEPQRDHGARQDGGGQVGQGKADEIGAGGRAGAAADGRITHEYMLPIR